MTTQRIKPLKYILHVKVNDDFDFMAFHFKHAVDEAKHLFCLHFPSTYTPNICVTKTFKPIFLQIFLKLI